MAYVADAPLKDPLTLEEALSRPDADLWREAINSELASLRSFGTWTLEDLPPDRKAIACKWVFKIKRLADGSIERYKARLVAKGFQQIEGVDYTEVFAPALKHSTLRTVLTVAATEDMDISHMDISTAFLNGELEEEMYMKQPPGYEEGDKVCRLHRTLYGLKQAPRAWHQRLVKELVKIGFTATHADPGLFTNSSTSDDMVLILVYVDDLIICSKDTQKINEVKKQIGSAFKARDLGDLTWFLGIRVQRDRERRLIMLDQKQYALHVLERFGMMDSKPVKTPMVQGLQLERLSKRETQSPYGELVGSLLYLAVCTRPDLAFGTSQLARHISAPGEQHWKAAKHMLRYLQGSKATTLQLGGKKTSMYAYCDSDFAGNAETRKSTTGFVLLVNDSAVVWSSKLQTTVATSTTEAEYTAMSSVTKEVLWLKKLMRELGYKDVANTATTIFCDNQGALKLVANPLATVKAKHIDVAHHFVRERAARGEIALEYCTTTQQVADVFTKVLPRATFEYCLGKIQLQSLEC